MTNTKCRTWTEWTNKAGVYNPRTQEIIAFSEEKNAIVRVQITPPPKAAIDRLVKQGPFDIAKWAFSRGYLDEAEIIVDNFDDTITKDLQVAKLNAEIANDPAWILTSDYSIIEKKPKKKEPLMNSPAKNLVIKVLDPDMPTPAYALPGDAGIDLCAAREVTVEPLTRAAVPLGIKCAIPEGKAGLLIPKSGRAAKEGLSQVNTPGLIDSGFRGELTFLAYNTDKDFPIVIQKHQKCCQLVIIDAPQVPITITDELDENTERGQGGFGSTGL